MAGQRARAAYRRLPVQTETSVLTVSAQVVEMGRYNL
jgi:23S rRNA U2552 (ribose-2'-O)-methylase RlmE/FtsJ